MVHLGDIKKIHDPPFVDCITFGSPCQDLSIAGKRAGLSGERSGLFMEAVRIIKEMRCHSGGAYPTFAIWENVPGAFSSNSGKDFHAVLEELARIEGPEISIPRPENGKWAKAGFIAGNGWSIAWRTFDAQFWGVPQRRKRIAVVLDLRGQRAGEILFERTGVSGNPEPSIPTWKGIAKNPARGTSGNDRVVESTGFTNRGRYSGVVSETLRAESHGAIPMVCAAFTAGQGAKANGIGYAEEQAPTLRTDGGLSAMPTVLCRAHGQANAETLEDCAPTLNCNHEQPIVFEIHSQDARYTYQGDTSPGGVAYQEVLTLRNDTVANALMARDYKGVGRADSLGKAVAVKTPLRWIVRRLTPTEGERLQGFPDGWTDIGEWTDSKGKRHKPADSPRYKALGNSIALPQWWWIVCKMAQYLPDRATLGSLFDGIGGFPLVWETLHGKGSAVWASEIEEFPIAVTKRRFPEEGEKSDEL